MSIRRAVVLLMPGLGFDENISGSDNLSVPTSDPKDGLGAIGALKPRPQGLEDSAQGFHPRGPSNRRFAALKKGREMRVPDQARDALICPKRDRNITELSFLLQYSVRTRR
jgi:hypothetical protein